MDNKSKKGYILMTTFAIMLIVTVLSVIIVLLIGNTTLFVKINNSSMQAELRVKEISNSYAVLSENDFISFMESDNYQFNEENDILTLTSNDMVIYINKTQPTIDEFTIIKGEKQIAKIVKENGVITSWVYHSLI